MDRKRLNSSMTYDEYISVYEKPPKKPCLKAKEAEQDIEDLDLDDVTQITIPQKISKYQTNNVIQEEDEDMKTPILQTQNLFITKPSNNQRPRAQSENIQYTFISFMEKGIERKQSKKHN